LLLSALALGADGALCELLAAAAGVAGAAGATSTPEAWLRRIL
jgi:hypothetical protein